MRGVIILTDSAVRNAVAIVAGTIQSRRTAIATLGDDDPEAELARITADLEVITDTIARSCPSTGLTARK